MHFNSYGYCVENTRYSADDVDRNTEICAGIPAGQNDEKVATCQGRKHSLQFLTIIIIII